MVGRERQVCIEQRLQPPSHAPVDRARLVLPQQAVVDEHELRAGCGRPLEELSRRRDGADELRNLIGSDDLHAHRPVVPERADVEELVGEGDDLVALRHGRRSLGHGRLLERGSGRGRRRVPARG